MAFRICFGFLVTTLLGAYALFCLGEVYEDTLDSGLGDPQASQLLLKLEQLPDQTASLRALTKEFRAAQLAHDTHLAEIMAAARDRAARTQEFFVLLSLLCGAGAAVFVYLSVMAPVGEMLRRMKDIATGRGDLGQRVHAGSAAELKELAHWMNVFLEKSERVIGGIANASFVVSTTTEQLGQHANRTNLAAAEISRNMMEQSMNLDECTGSLGHIDDLLQNSGESTRQAASLSKITMDRALHGGNSVQETIEAMEKIEESSHKIEALVISINDIASQTNLLAINAAIEATKAGEHGKGFAVVAEEVRKLAERARKLTGEVTGLMNESGMRVKAGVSLAQGAGVSLDGIIKDVEAVSSLIQRIAAASAKQAEKSGIVLEFMQKVSGAVRTNLVELEEVTRTAEFTAFEVGKLDALVGQLNQIVENVEAPASTPAPTAVPSPVPVSEEVTKAMIPGLAPLPAAADLPPADSDDKEGVA